MFLRPILICAAGVLALQLLTVRADSGIIPLEIPKGWSGSISIGRQYFMGYDSREKAYFINNIGPIEPTGRLINADTVPSPGGHHVPYSAQGMKPSDLWSASLLQTIDAAPFRQRKLRFEAEVKSPGFHGHLYILLRGKFPSGSTNTMSGAESNDGWRTVVSEIEQVPDDVDDSTVTFGLVMQGEGRVLIRSAKLTSLDYAPEAPSTHLEDVFGDPPATSKPANLELSR